jgi:membrane-bound ClpP family serine protease
VTSTRRDSTRPAEAVAGVMAACALFLGVLQLAYRPFRLAPVALILALVATVMSRDQQRLIGLAVAVIGVCFVIGAAIQVITHHPLF